MAYITQTQIYQIDAQLPNLDIIALAAETLRRGRLVAFPTETVYGLGANALDSEAINRIYAAKKRPATDPVIAHIHDIAQLNELAHDIPSVAYALAGCFWPGALTLILKRGDHVPSNIATGRDTIAVRMPSHPIAKALLSVSNLPIAAPSANLFTRPSATTAIHVLEDLDGGVDVILDGGPTPIGLESTVLDLTQDIPVVMRPGGIMLSNLRKIIPDLQLKPRYCTDNALAESSPGQLLKHYSPSAQVVVYTGDVERVLTAIRKKSANLRLNKVKVGVLLMNSDLSGFPHDVYFYDLGADLGTASKRLFAGLRALDTQGVDVIFARDFGREGLGVALWDRLIRAAEGSIIVVE